MNDITYTGYILEQHRAADLARENELIVARRERGTSSARPHRRPLAAWLRAASHRAAPQSNGVASGRSAASVATR
ncbi:hypothetical protein B1729_18470 [Microbacterium sp. B35-04]|uniref:hypothetical protein n=1 Tax=unclassified Microbacterium TaxID=2609290 RepID=UPI0013D8903A|nr:MULTISPECIES: hypothetical protein [unclassified Microbacterium]KAF2411791.1 hypothetical protein B1729_18470 [Microbacterium sp. B35-04]KAF2415653.1 hypothetical protein B2K11_19190 [Microbacterium sp. B35-30]